MARTTSFPVAAPGTAIDAVLGRSLALHLLLALRPAHSASLLDQMTGVVAASTLIALKS